MLFFLVGLSSWVLIEYLMHRFVLHGRGNTSHKPHHKNPKNKNDLFISWKYVAIVSIILCAFCLIFFSGISVILIYLGAICGYFSYETIHYRVHHCKSKTRWMRYLRRHHLQHHFTNESYNYSIVFPPLDYLFNSRYRR